jgi:hypothetical protein
VVSQRYKNHGGDAHVKTILSLLFAAVFLSALGLAQAADPVVGTWTLDSAKSKVTSQAPPKSETRTYSQSDDGTISLNAKTVESDGRETNESSGYKVDGKDYPFKADTIDADSVSLKRVNSHVTEFRLKKNGKVVETGRRTVSPDGKTLTLTQHGTDAHGAKFTDISVYDKQ